MLLSLLIDISLLALLCRLRLFSRGIKLFSIQFCASQRPGIEPKHLDSPSST